MWGHGIDVRGDNEGLDLIALDLLGRARMVDGIDQREQLRGLVSRAELRKGEDRPHGGMAVLPAILAQARRIALDVAGIERRLVEGRREQERQAVVATDEMLFQGSHRHRGAHGIGRARQHRPGLGNGIDPAFLVRLRTEPGSIIEGRAAIPFAVPRFALERLPHRGGMVAPASGAVSVATFRQRREELDGPHQQPAEPDAFAPPTFADPAHPVIPVACADERQAVFASQIEALIEAAGAVLEQ